MSELLTSKEIKKFLAEKGYDTNRISVKKRGGQYDLVFNVELKDVEIDIREIEKLLSQFEKIDRDEVTGETLNGGNTYIFIEYDYEHLKEMADKYEAYFLNVLREKIECPIPELLANKDFLSDRYMVELVKNEDTEVALLNKHGRLELRIETKEPKDLLFRKIGDIEQLGKVILENGLYRLFEEDIRKKTDQVDGRFDITTCMFFKEFYQTIDEKVETCENCTGYKAFKEDVEQLKIANQCTGLCAISSNVWLKLICNETITELKKYVNLYEKGLLNPFREYDKKDNILNELLNENYKKLDNNINVIGYLNIDRRVGEVLKLEVFGCTKALEMYVNSLRDNDFAENSDIYNVVLDELSKIEDKFVVKGITIYPKDNKYKIMEDKETLEVLERYKNNLANEKKENEEESI